MSKFPNAKLAAKAVIDYSVMTLAIANAALSRRAALQVEIAVSLIHFTQEKGQTDTTGKANLKAVYHGAGYECLTKADRDYKTVNRRLNAMAKLFDKVGSSLVNNWIGQNVEASTEQLINAVVIELAAYGWDTLDDVLEYVGVDTNRQRAPRQPVAAPVVNIKPEAGEDKAEDQAAPARPDLDVIYAELTANYGPELLKEFCSRILVHVATVETAQEQAQELKAA